MTVILLCIPGTSIPDEGLFSTPDIDKFVHVVLFGGIVLLWAFYLYFRRSQKLYWQKTVWLLTFLAIVLGIVLEFLQLYCIPNRSFDASDIIADAAGALAAAVFHLYARVK